MANKVTDGLNRGVPFFLNDYGYANIAAADFDPITTETDWRGALDNSQLDFYRKNGFLVRPWTDGAFYAITWNQYYNALKAAHGQAEAVVLAALVPQEFLAVGGTWVECLLVKVFANNDGDYQTASTEINIGLLL